MKARTLLRSCSLLLAALLLSCPLCALACATCYGQSDSPLAQGMNWGIFTLLIVVGLVLGSVAAFFLFLARRSALGTDARLSEGTRSEHSD